MRIQQFTAGPYGTDCYCVYEYNGNGCLLIDAPYPMDRMLSFISGHGLTPEAVLLTHGHFDHIFGLSAVRSAYPELPVLIGEEDLSFIQDGYRETVNLLSSFDPLFLSRYASAAIDGMPDDLTPYGETAGPFTVIRTPGHTAGSVSLYSKEDKAVFTGDTLFKGSVGRTDIGGDAQSLLESVRKLRALPDDTLVFPGHGMMTDIGTEKASNPYMR